MILKTLVGVAEGMQWLHSNNTVHGDLKAANVMLTVEPTDRQADNTMASKADNDVEYDLFSEVLYIPLLLLLLFLLSTANALLFS